MISVNSPSCILVVFEEKLETWSFNGEKISQRKIDSGAKMRLLKTEANYYQDCVVMVDHRSRLWVMGLPFLEIKRIELLEEDKRDWVGACMVDYVDAFFAVKSDSEVVMVRGV